MLTTIVRSTFASAFVLLAVGTTVTPAIATTGPCDIPGYCAVNGIGSAGLCDQCLTGGWAGWGFIAFTNNGGASCVPCSNAIRVPAAQFASCNACEAAGGIYAVDSDECFINGASTAPACQPPPVCEIADYCSQNYPGAEGPCMDCLEGDYLLPWGFGAFSVAAGGPGCMPCDNHNIPHHLVSSCEHCLVGGGTYSVDTDECFFGGALADPACHPMECDTMTYCQQHMPMHPDFCHECLNGVYGWSALIDAGGGASCVPCGSQWLDPVEQLACDMCMTNGGFYSALTNECFYDGISLGSC